jgi:hypothetical protein
MTLQTTQNTNHLSQLKSFCYACCEAYERVSVVGIATGVSRVPDTFFSPKTSKPATGPTQPLI